MTSTLTLGCIFVVLATTASAQTSGTATGTLTIDGKSFKLSHAHAQEVKDPFMGAKQIRIVLSDVPIVDETMEDDTGVEDLVQAGKLNAIEYTFTPSGELTGGHLVHGLKSVAFTQASANFTKQTFDAKTAAGKVWTDQPAPEMAEMKYASTATFTAPIQREAKPTAQGATAAATGPGQVASQYMKAARAKDFATIKKVSGPAGVQMLEGPGAKEQMDGIVRWMKPGLDIVRVYEWSNFAKVDFAMKDGSGVTTMTLVKMGGAWKVK